MKSNFPKLNNIEILSQSDIPSFRTENIDLRNEICLLLNKNASILSVRKFKIFERNETHLNRPLHQKHLYQPNKLNEL